MGKRFFFFFFCFSFLFRLYPSGKPHSDDAPIGRPQSDDLFAFIPRREVAHFFFCTRRRGEMISSREMMRRERGNFDLYYLGGQGERVLVFARNGPGQQSSTPTWTLTTRTTEAHPEPRPI